MCNSQALQNLWEVRIAKKERVVPKMLKILSEGASLDASITLGKDSAAVCFP